MRPVLHRLCLARTRVVRTSAELIRGFDRILSYHFRLGMLLDKVEINLDPAQNIVRSMQGR